MNLIAVDDERLALRALVNALNEAVPGAALEAFSTPGAALAHAEKAPVDVAFLDVEMGGMTGLELAKALKDIHGKTNIIFVTGYSQYAVDAFRISASGYVMKPVQPEEIRREMQNLRQPVRPCGPGVRVQTFGNFEVFVNGRPLDFRRGRAKEVLAYLVDRKGASVTKKELAGILWGDAEYTRSNQVYLQMLVTELQRALDAAGAGDILRRRRNNLSIDPDKLECDYYGFLNGDAAAVNQYQGEYMANYSWAEWTQGALATAKRREMR